MTLDAYPVRATQPELVEYPIRLLGTGASAPTIEEGDGVTIARTGAGAYTITWGDNPGTFYGFTYALGAATPADVAGHTVVRDTFASLALPILLSNAAEAAHDLAANEYLDIVVRFKRTSL